MYTAKEYVYWINAPKIPAFLSQKIWIVNHKMKGILYQEVSQDKTQYI